MSIHYLKKSFYSGLVFFGTVLGLSIGYSALIWGLTTSDKVGTGSWLSATVWNKIIDGVVDLDTKTTTINSTLASQFTTYSNTSSYVATNITLTAAAQNFATIMTLPSAGTYFIWINARIDLPASACTHFFLSTTPAGTPLFWINYIGAPSTSGIASTYSNMWTITTTGPTTIYAGGTGGAGTLSIFWAAQSTAGYLKLK